MIIEKNEIINMLSQRYPGYEWEAQYNYYCGEADFVGYRGVKIEVKKCPGCGEEISLRKDTCGDYNCAFTR